jgi:endonuclease YncB( thermonuclease family)
MIKVWKLVLIAVLLSGALAAMLGYAMAAEESINGRAAVIDGGTLKVGQHTLKLVGIIAPSATQKCQRGALPWLCGASSRRFLEELVKNRDVRCRKHGTYFARCFVDNKDLAERLVRNGWAVPNGDGEGYRAAEAQARDEQRGMWQGTN